MSNLKLKFLTDFVVQEMACIHYANYIGDLDLLQAISRYLKLDQKMPYMSQI